MPAKARGSKVLLFCLKDSSRALLLSEYVICAFESSDGRLTYEQEFAGFAKERGAIEEKHAAALMKLSESGQAAARRGELRQGSYSHSYGQMSYLHTQIAQNEQNFGVALSHVYVELMELSIDKERTRKQLKHESSVAEKRVQDAEMAMQKAKGKYNSLAEDYDRARTGDRQSGRFGLKGPKSAAQVEEELHRKMQSADSDYATKVQQAQSLRADLVNTQRPQAVKTITQLVQECDAALTLHLQNYGKYTFHARCFVLIAFQPKPTRQP